MDNSKKLIYYCLNNLVCRPEFIDYMKAESNWFLSELYKYDVLKEIKVLAGGIKRKIGLQKIMHQSMEKEIIEIFKYSDHVVGLKGFFIEKAYYPQNIVRFYNDIDIIVEDHLGYSTYRFLKNIGYDLEKKRGLVDNKNWAISLMKSEYFKRTHHVILKKNVDSFPIELELHGNICRCKSCILNFDRNSMIENAKKKEFGYLNFSLFEPEENIVYLMYHCIKHLSYTSYILSNNSRVNLQRLYDVAQIILLEEINWYKFILFVCESNTSSFISLYLKIFNEVFPKMIPNDVIMTLNQEALKSEFKWKDTYCFVMEQKVPDIILGTCWN